MGIVEWVAGAFILAGVWFYGRKSRLGPTCSMVGCLMWLCIGIYAGMWSLAVLNAILFATNTYNLVAWCQGQKHIELTDDPRYRRHGLTGIILRNGETLNFSSSNQEDSSMTMDLLERARIQAQRVPTREEMKVHLGALNQKERAAAQQRVAESDPSSASQRPESTS